MKIHNNRLHADAQTYAAFVGFAALHFTTKASPVWALVSRALNIHVYMNRRIELLKANRGDAEQVFESWGINRSNFRYLSAMPQSTVADAQLYLNGVLSNPADPVFHIRLCDTGGIVGLIKARREAHRALVGYVIDEAFWGRGIATEALREMIGLLRRDSSIQRIWATCATDNPGSSAVLEKCGFVREGVLRRWIVYPAQGPESHDNYSYYLPANV